ncbi:MAG: DedA family protein [Candidatus Delongbacteria bacterium]|nr:DedA family protein [Candidatus Delongbacteria bacterium]
MQWIKRIYDWVLSWAESPYSTLALIILAFSESSFFPVPPDVLLIALVLGKPQRAFRLAAFCSAASIIGGIAGYGIGYFIWHQVSHFFFSYIPGFTPQIFNLVQSNYQHYGFWYVLVAGFTPIPYKVFTIAAGVFQMELIPFILASVISRSARFFIVSALLYFFGAPIKNFIDKYFNLLTFAFLGFIILGFIVIKYIF